MGFYIKKGFNFGPVRVNLSKSGLGVSVGAKGFRLGTGPKGNYIHAGREGLYYRKSLGKSFTIAIIVMALVLLAGYYLWQSGVISINL